jgi:hypothetical protein
MGEPLCSAKAGAVAFGTIVATQLSQTMDAGRSEGTLSRPVVGAVGGSVAFLLSTLTLRPLRDLLGLALPTPIGWTLMGTGALAAVALGRLLAVAGSESPGRSAVARRQERRAPAALLLPSP